MKTKEVNASYVGALVKVTKRGKTYYGMVDGVYGNTTYGFISSDAKDGSWTTALAEPNEVEFLETETEKRKAYKAAMGYIKAEGESLDWKIKRLADEKAALKQLAYIVREKAV